MVSAALRRASNRTRAVMVAGLAGLVLVDPSAVRGQVLFDWPVRARVGPEALQNGAPALLWNPAGSAPTAANGREVWVVHIDGPDASGVQGLAGAVLFDLPFVGRVGVAYQHLGIPDIARTTDSPEPEPGPLTVAEDVAVVGVARSAGAGIRTGVSARFLRGTVGSRRRDRVSLDAGVQAAFGGELQPRLGAVVRSLGTGSDLLVGGLAALPTPWPERLTLDAGYGAQTRLSRIDAHHRFTARGVWDEVLALGLGVQSNHGGGWTTVWEGRIDVGPYSLGVVRESLPNDFGAAHFFQATIGLGGRGTEPSSEP